jgi:hypothetical protein
MTWPDILVEGCKPPAGDFGQSHFASSAFFDMFALGWRSFTRVAGLLGFIDDIKAGLRRRSRRLYYARREAEALRLQHGDGAEAWCDQRLARPDLTFGRGRFLRLVRKALANI